MQELIMEIMLMKVLLTLLIGYIVMNRIMEYWDR